MMRIWIAIFLLAPWAIVGLLYSIARRDYETPAIATLFVICVGLVILGAFALMQVHP